MRRGCSAVRPSPAHPAGLCCVRSPRSVRAPPAPSAIPGVPGAAPLGPCGSCTLGRFGMRSLADRSCSKRCLSPDEPARFGINPKTQDRALQTTGSGIPAWKNPGGTAGSCDVLRGDSECELEPEAREGPGRFPESRGMLPVLEYSAPLMAADSAKGACA